MHVYCKLKKNDSHNRTASVIIQNCETVQSTLFVTAKYFYCVYGSMFQLNAFHIVQQEEIDNDLKISYHRL